MTTMLKKQRRLRTIWRLPDDLWAETPTATAFRKASWQVIDGILYVLRTGCQWKALPREYGSGSRCHRRFQAWVQTGVFEKFWTVLLLRYDEVRGIQWK